MELFTNEIDCCFFVVLVVKNEFVFKASGSAVFWPSERTQLRV